MCKDKLADIIEAGKNIICVNSKMNELTEDISRYQRHIKSKIDEMASLLASQKTAQENSSKKFACIERSVDDLKSTAVSENEVKKKFETNLKKIVKDEVQVVKEKVTDVMQTLGKAQQEGSNRNPGPAPRPMSTEVARSVKECMEQEKRRNVVIHNLKEPNADQHLEEKQAQDKQEFQAMCKKKNYEVECEG